MSAYGLGNAGVRTNKTQPPVAPTVTAANDGLSLSGTIVQLGQTVGAVGDPAALLDDREIPMGGFSFSMFDAPGLYLLIDPVNGAFNFGDVPLQTYLDIDSTIPFSGLRAGGLLFGLDDSAELALLRNAAGRYLVTDIANERYQFGDIDNTSMGLLLDINGANDSIQLRSPLVQFFIGQPDSPASVTPSASFGAIAPFDSTAWLLGINTGTGAGFATLENSAGSRLIDGSMPNGFLNLGGVGGADNGNGVFISDANETVQVRVNERSGFRNSGISGDWYLDIDPAGFFVFGDASNAGNGTKLIIDDAGELVELLSGGNDYLYLDAANGNYAIGDYSGANNSSYLQVQDGLEQIEGRINGNLVMLLSATDMEYSLGDFGGQGNSTYISIDDDLADQNLKVFAVNGIKITGDPTLLHTGTALSNNAGAAAGTLGNAPTAGDPAKWIAIDDNGTTRYIPTWI